MTILTAFQTLGTIAAVAIATLALTRDKKKDDTQEKQLCVKHEETIKTLVSNVEVIFKRIEQASKSGQGHDVKIARLEVQLENIQIVTNEIKSMLVDIRDTINNKRPS